MFYVYTGTWGVWALSLVYAWFMPVYACFCMVLRTFPSFQARFHLFTHVSIFLRTCHLFTRVIFYVCHVLRVSHVLRVVPGLDRVLRTVRTETRYRNPFTH